MRTQEHKGKKVQLIEMIGEPQMKNSLIGTIQNVDDSGQFHVNWNNGRTLALIPDKDKYTILTEKEIRKMKLNKLNNNEI
jgi:hypothetical protein